MTALQSGSRDRIGLEHPKGKCRLVCVKAQSKLCNIEVLDFPNEQGKGTIQIHVIGFRTIEGLKKVIQFRHNAFGDWRRCKLMDNMCDYIGDLSIPTEFQKQTYYC